MVFKVILFLCLFFLTSTHSVACNVQQAKEILANYQWYSEDYPPYNYQNKDGRLVGIFPEILELIYKEFNLDMNLNDVMIVPWARLFHTLETSPVHAAFSMVKSPERNKKFTLISLPIMSKVSIIALEENKNILDHKSIEKLSYAVVRQDIGEHLLDAKFNVKNKVVTTSANSMLSMLLYHRVEAIAYSELVAQFQLSHFGLEDIKLTSIYTFNDVFESAFVFHKDTPKCFSTLFSQTISLLDEKGEINRIMQKYQY